MTFSILGWDGLERFWHAIIRIVPLGILVLLRRITRHNWVIRQNQVTRYSQVTRHNEVTHAITRSRTVIWVTVFVFIIYWLHLTLDKENLCSFITAVATSVFCKFFNHQTFILLFYNR